MSRFQRPEHVFLVLQALYSVVIFTFAGPLGLLGSGMGKQNTTEAGVSGA